MKGRSVRAPLIVLLVSTVTLVWALVGGARAGSIPAPMLMPPVGLARPAMPAAPGTITTPVTPTVPPSPTPGKSTITIPGVSGSDAASTRNPGTVRPCGTGSGAAGAIPGNAGIATAPGANPNNTATGVPNIPAGGSGAASTATTNPSVRPGVPSSC
jgi:hypothetical protein